MELDEAIRLYELNKDSELTIHGKFQLQPLIYDRKNYIYYSVRYYFLKRFYKIHKNVANQMNSIVVHWCFHLMVYSKFKSLIVNQTRENYM